MEIGPLSLVTKEMQINRSNILGTLAKLLKKKKNKSNAQYWPRFRDWNTPMIDLWGIQVFIIDFKGQAEIIIKIF